MSNWTFENCNGEPAGDCGCYPDQSPANYNACGNCDECYIGGDSSGLDGNECDCGCSSYDACGTCGGSCDICDCGCNVTFDACGGCNGYGVCDCGVGDCNNTYFPCPSEGGCSCQDGGACDQDAFGTCLYADACGTCDGPYDDCDCNVPNCVSGLYFGCAPNGGCGCQSGSACDQDAFGTCLYLDCNNTCGGNAVDDGCGCGEAAPSSDDFGNTCCFTSQGTDYFGYLYCVGGEITPTCSDYSACDEDGTGCLYHACNGSCTSRTPTLYPNCPQPSIKSSLLHTYKLGILPIPSNNAALKNKLLAETINFPLILQARASVSYHDGLYGKRYVGYYPYNLGVNSFGTLPRSTGTNSVHGDEEATVDFYNFTSSDIQDYNFYSWQWLGYFKAPYTDDFVFRISNVDDAVYLWIGNNAISGFTNENSTTGGLYMANNSSDPIHMISGHYYPVRLQFGENDGADQFILDYSSSTESNVSNFQGKFYHKTNQDFPA